MTSLQGNVLREYKESSINDYCCIIQHTLTGRMKEWWRKKKNLYRACTSLLRGRSKLSRMKMYYDSRRSREARDISLSCNLIFTNYTFYRIWITFPPLFENSYNVIIIFINDKNIYLSLYIDILQWILIIGDMNYFIHDKL